MYDWISKMVKISIIIELWWLTLDTKIYSRSHLGWHFRMLFRSSKLKAWSSLFAEMWQKRCSNFELWAFKNDTPSEIGCTFISFMDCILSIVRFNVCWSSSQNSFWDCYGSFDDQRLFSVKITVFRNFFYFAQIWGILESTNCEKFNADGSLMGRTNLDKSV